MVQQLLRAEEGGRQLDCVRLEVLDTTASTTSSISSTCEISLFGCHVLSWSVAGRQLLWMSSLSAMDGSVPIRGGVPIAFPQFADNGPLKLHGYVREAVWTLVSSNSNNNATAAEDVAVLRYENHDNGRDGSGAENPCFAMEIRIVLTINTLAMSMKVENISNTSMLSFSTCFHPYFKTENIRNVRIHGLKSCEYIDKVQCRKVCNENNDYISIESASHDSGSFVDRIYHRKAAESHDGDAIFSVIEDVSHTITVRQSPSFVDTVVFNPWEEGKKGPAHPDFDDDGFNYMVCVEPAVAVSPVQLSPQSLWTGDMTLVYTMK